MQLFVAKLVISTYPLYLAYAHTMEEVLQGTLKQAVELNINQLPIHDRNKEFLRIYLINVILFTLCTSALMVLTRSILPKLISALGIALWAYFSIPPGIPPQFIMLKILEEVSIIGGILLIAGSEYVNGALSIPEPEKEKRKD